MINKWGSMPPNLIFAFLLLLKVYIISIVISCTAHKNDISDYKVMVDSIQTNENFGQMTKIYHLGGDSLLMKSDLSQLALIVNGRQIKTYGVVGPGPKEFLNFGSYRVWKDTLYIHASAPVPGIMKINMKTNEVFSQFEYFTYAHNFIVDSSGFYFINETYSPRMNPDEGIIVRVDHQGKNPIILRKANQFTDFNFPFSQVTDCKPILFNGSIYFTFPLKRFVFQYIIKEDSLIKHPVDLYFDEEKIIERQESIRNSSHTKDYFHKYYHSITEINILNENNMAIITHNFSERKSIVTWYKNGIKLNEIASVNRVYIKVDKKYYYFIGPNKSNNEEVHGIFGKVPHNQSID